jgi:hypothetical protein
MVNTVKVDDFENGIAGWSGFKVGPAGFSPDLEARVGITDKAAQVKSGKGSLYYIYTVAPKTIGLLALERRLALTGMQSIRFQVKCDAPTLMVFAAREKNGARYDTFLYCPANKWQDVAIDLDDLKPAADAKDDNTHLDLDQLAGIYLADAAGVFIEAFSGQGGPRIMYLDNIEYSSRRVALQRPQLGVPATGQPIIVDDFEGGAIRWIPLLMQTQPVLNIDITDADLKLDKQSAPNGGAKSMKATYKRERGNIEAWLHSLENVNLKSAQTLDLSLKTVQDGMFLVFLKEKDDSRYQQVISLKAENRWQQFSWPLASFKLADDSTDENGKLDPGQIEEISLADITGLLPAKMANGPLGNTSLWLDEVQFGVISQPKE